MKYWCGAVAVAMCLGVAQAVFAADNELTDQEKQEGWILLFDGKTLNGWETSDEKPSVKPVEDGCINPHGCGAYYMMPAERFADYELRLDFKTSPKCNSGILLRAEPKFGDAFGGDTGYYALEVAIDDALDSGYHATGAIYDLVPVATRVLKPVGEWNHVEIYCKDTIVKVTINGVETAAMDLNAWLVAGKRPDGSDTKFGYSMKYRSRTGFIGLQDHGGDIWFKNIKLKKLD